MDITCYGARAFLVLPCIVWKKDTAGGMVKKSRPFLVWWITVSIFLYADCDLSHACMNGDLCNSSNGSSSSKCDLGYYGLCCKVENIALGMPAYQSSTYEDKGIQFTADYAVNGIAPQFGDVTERNCSHTAPSPMSHWWYVTLSNSSDYVLKYVTIVRRQVAISQDLGSNGLGDFYILYTSNATGSPNLTTWKTCKYNREYQNAVTANYTCDNTAIGRRVAIYLDSSQRERKLILCEIYIDGFPYDDTGIQGGVHISRERSGEIISVSFSRPFSVAYNYLLVSIKSTWDDTVMEGRVVSSNPPLPVTFNVIANCTYEVSLVPAICCFGTSCLTCEVDTRTSDNGKCVVGQRSQPVLIGSILLSGAVQNGTENLKNAEDEMKMKELALIIGGIASGVVLLTILIIILLLIRRKARETQQNGDTTGLNVDDTATNANHAYIEDDIDEEDPTYGNTVGMDFAEFEKYSENETSVINKFYELRGSEVQSHENALYHEKKNRFKDIVPYDFNRVILQQGSHDYINASYINGVNRRNKYIATQGPTTATIADFWNMVWQEKVTIIVMLTPHVEESKKKCRPYFPIKNGDKYGVLVGITSDTTFDSHKLSVLNVKQQEETRTVYHFHFFAWPDGSVPDHAGDLIMFMTKVRKMLPMKRVQRSPVVVHCSAGVGRTGAYIALDYQLDRFLIEKRVDIDNCVVGLRDQRMHMVQTKEQYAFIHKALVYGMKTLTCVRESTELTKWLNNRGKESDLSLSAEWELLEATSRKLAYDHLHYTTASLPENESKNRHPDILACERKMPILGGLNGPSQTYINAVFCNGCYAKNAFIATQWPMSETIPSFWELVYDCSPGCIVVLHRSPSLEEYPRFYPVPGTTLTAGAFDVTNMGSSRDQEDAVSQHELSVRLNSSTSESQQRTIHLIKTGLFTLDSEVPENMNETVKFMIQLASDCKQSSQQRPIIVVCKDGASYCGLFLAAANSLHRMIESGHVQVFHTVDVLRASRRQFVGSLVQYNYIYQLLDYYNYNKSTFNNL